MRVKENSRSITALRMVLFAVLAVFFLAFAWEAAYASDEVASGNWGSCHWEISKQGTLTVHPGQGAERAANAVASPWGKWAGKIKRVVFKKEGTKRVVAPVCSRALLGHLYNMKSVDLAGIDTSATTDMNDFFFCCYKLESVNLKPLDTSNVVNMNGMFEACEALRNIDLNPMTTESAQSMCYMFSGCKLLKSINLEPLNTAHVKKMTGMFSECSALASLDLSCLNTAEVDDMSSLVQSCSSLKSINLTGFKTNNVLDMNAMFAECKSLRSVDLSQFNASNVRSMNAMFAGCSSLPKVKLPLSYTSNLVDFDYLFSRCKSLKAIDLAPLGASKPSSLRGVFNGCKALKAVDLRPIDASNAVSAESLFAGCSSLTSVNLTKFDATKIKSMDYLFSKCAKLKTLKLGKKFRFKGKRVFDEYYEEDGGIYPTGTKGCSLPNARSKTPYLGKWVNSRGKLFTSGKIWKDYRGESMSGTWTWAVRLSKAKAAKIKDRRFTGKPIKPKIKLTLGKTTLKQGRDFTVAYKNNKKPGKAKAIVKGKGRYVGTKTVFFRIVKKTRLARA